MKFLLGSKEGIFMSCNICGGDEYGMKYCSRFDCDICEDCIPCNISIKEGEPSYCNGNGSYKDCDCKDGCSVIGRFKELEKEENEWRIKNEVCNKIVKYFKDRDIECIESIWQTDRGTDGIVEFLEELYKIINQSY